jgi:hypothetical protein
LLNGLDDLAVSWMNVQLMAELPLVSRLNPPMPPPPLAAPSF